MLQPITMLLPYLLQIMLAYARAGVRPSTSKLYDVEDLSSHNRSTEIVAALTFDWAANLAHVR